MYIRTYSDYLCASEEYKASTIRTIVLNINHCLRWFVLYVLKDASRILSGNNFCQLRIEENLRYYSLIVNELLRDLSRELSKKSLSEGRRALVNKDAIKLRREPVGGLPTLRKYLHEDINKIQKLLQSSKETPLMLQQHNQLIGFLLSFICTEMPQVIYGCIH